MLHQPPRLWISSLILLGQMFSVVGSSLTSFALGIWVYQTYENVTGFALILLFTAVPGIIISPFAGTLVDRWNRRLIIMGSDAAAGLATCALLGLLLTNTLSLWHVYGFSGLIACCNAFQVPASMAALTYITPKKYLGQFNGFMQGGQAIAQIGSPLMASWLVNQVGLHSVLYIDLITCIAAITTLSLVRFPSMNLARAVTQMNFWEDIKGGWRYMADRPTLLLLLGFIATLNFIAGSIEAVFTPLVLSFASVKTLGVLSSVGGIGLLAGSLTVGLWGGPKRRLRGMIIAMAITGLVLLGAGFRPTPSMVGIAMFLYLFNVPIIETCNVSIWQHKVPPDLHGRVFALRRSIVWLSLPLAYGIAGPLADKVFRPWFLPNGALADSLGRLIGVGEGRGIAFFLMCLGLLTLLLVAIGIVYQPLRNVETQLPDMLPDDPINEYEPSTIS